MLSGICFRYLAVPLLTAEARPGPTLVRFFDWRCFRTHLSATAPPATILSVHHVLTISVVQNEQEQLESILEQMTINAFFQGLAEADNEL